jgi:hypothetical protein
MSGFRVILAFVMAAAAGTFAVTTPAQRTMWIAISGVCAVIGIFRLRRYRRMKELEGSPSDGTTEQL